MKVLVSDDRKPMGTYINEYSYTRTKPNEILMFGLLQSDYDPQPIYTMIGITTRKKTTYIKVKELDISKKFYKELISNSLIKEFNTCIEKSGDFQIKFNNKKYTFNINTIVEELLNKANGYEDGEYLICVNRTLYPSNIFIDVN